MGRKEHKHKKENRDHYSYPEAYPSLEGVEPNRRYAALLMNDYAGCSSELTAINQYMYAHFWADSEDQEALAELFEGIAIVEMRHLELLAEAIIALGGDPQYRGESGSYWTARNVNYGNNACERIRAAITDEKKAMKTYRKHIYEIDDPVIIKLLERIVRDEEVHLALLCRAFERYCRTS